MTSHLGLTMPIVFAVLVAAVFAALGHDEPRAQWTLGTRILLGLVGGAFLLGGCSTSRSDDRAAVQPGGRSSATAA